MASGGGFSVPPYIQNYGVSDAFSLNQFDPETAAEMQALNRRQQIANLLTQQGIAPMSPGVQAGRFYVGPSWTQGVEHIGKALAGALLTRSNDKARQDLEAQQAQNRQNAIQRYTEQTYGAPALTVPEGSQGPERPEIPATPESRQQALAQLITNRDPAVQRYAQFQQAMQAKQAEAEAARKQAIELANIKAAHEAALKGVPSADVSNRIAADQERAAAERALKQQQFEGVSGNTAATIEAQNQRAAAEQALKREQFAGVSGNTQATIDAQNQRAAQDLAARERMHAAPSGSTLAQIDAQAALKNQDIAQRQSELEARQEQERAKLELERAKFGNTQEYQKATLAQQDRHQQERADLEREKLAQTKELHQTPSGNALAQIDAQAALQQQTIAQKKAELDQRHAMEAQKLELDRARFGNTKEQQAKELALKERQQKELNEYHQATLAQQKELHQTPSGSALAHVDAQAQIALQGHQDRMMQFEQNKRQDAANLELRKQQGLSEDQYKRDKLAMEERHQKEQEALARERNDIARQFHQAQTGKVEDKKAMATYNAGLKEVAQDQKAVDQAAELETALKRWMELQSKVDTGPVVGHRPTLFQPDFQEMKQLENKLAVSNFKPGQGQISNFERELIKGAGPTTTKDPATNQNIIQIMLGGVQNMKDRANFREWYLEQNGKLLGADKAWNDYIEQNPRFTQDKAGNIVPNPNRADWMTHFSGGQPSAPATGGPTAKAAPQAPPVGTIKGGYRFKGGDPASPSSWEKQ